MTPKLIKYPRTPHLEGSNIQPGDDDLDRVPFTALIGQHVVVEEKLDGSNAALRFSSAGKILLQSRGHYLRGGPRERHFALLKTWANSVTDVLWPVLGTRYVVYGEWLYAKHTIFYDALPHYFLEFDVLDTQHGVFLDTPSRKALLEGLPITSAPVLGAGSFTNLESLTRLIGPSGFIGTVWNDHLRETCVQNGLDGPRVVRETDPSGLMEGLYLKFETNGIVQSRLKYVRSSFTQAVQASDSHWFDRPIVPNRLRDGASLW
jgi:hypothetical protein